MGADEFYDSFRDILGFRIVIEKYKPKDENGVYNRVNKKIVFNNHLNSLLPARLKTIWNAVAFLFNQLNHRRVLAFPSWEGGPPQRWMRRSTINI